MSFINVAKQNKKGNKNKRGGSINLTPSKLQNKKEEEKSLGNRENR